MQLDPRKVAYLVALLAAGLFAAALVAPKKRVALYSMSALGLGLSKVFLQIGEKEMTAQ